MGFRRPEANILHREFYQHLPLSPNPNPIVSGKLLTERLRICGVQIKLPIG
jgi:hypothetical protein